MALTLWAGISLRLARSLCLLRVRSYFSRLVVLACRVVATRRSLSRRVRLVVLAPDSFAPSLDSVLRCAAQLSRVRRFVGGWFDTPASAVRVLLDTNMDGLARYSLVVPERSLPAVRAALANYDRVQLHPVEPEAPAGGGTGGGRECVVRAELRLARPSSEPLAHLPLDPDPLQSFAQVLAKAHGTSQARVEVAVDLLPCTAGARRRLHRRLLREAHRASPACGVGGGGLFDVLSGNARPAGRQPAADVVGQRVLREQLATKLLQAEPLFQIQVLLRCTAGAQGVAADRMQALLGCFDGWAAANSFRVTGVRLFGLAFLGADIPGRRKRFDQRMGTGLFAPARRDVVGAREIAGFLKPPTQHCASEHVLGLGPAVYPAPQDLPCITSKDQENVVPLGRVKDETGERIVGLRLADTFFTYVAGRSRWGKTELAITQFLHLVRSGHGGLFLDPHEDAIARIKSCLTEPELAGRVLELDLVGPRSRDGQPGWNPLAAHGLSDDERERRVEAIVDSFASALQWGERNNRALTLTTQATAALIELSTVLPEDLQPTIFQIPTLLGNPEWREVALPFLSVPRRQFFSERFPRMAEEAITPVTNLIDRMRSSTQLAALLGAQASTYDIARAMDERRDRPRLSRRRRRHATGS